MRKTLPGLIPGLRLILSLMAGLTLAGCEEGWYAQPGYYGYGGDGPGDMDGDHHPMAPAYGGYGYGGYGGGYYGYGMLSYGYGMPGVPGGDDDHGDGD